jgi:hypothetical protein
MKKIRTFCVVLCCTLLVSLMSACGDKVAEDLAQQLIAVANSYQEQVDRTNEAERKAYKKLASTYVEAQRNDVFLSLEQERIERAGKIADEATEVKQTPPTLSEIESQLREYANLDFETTQKLMKEESEARAQYLAELAQLNSDSAKVEALGKSFAALAKSKSRADQVKEVVSYYEETKKEFDKLFCDDLTAKIGNVQKQVDGKKTPPAIETTDAKAKRLASLEALQAELDALTKQKAAKKCT